MKLPRRIRLALVRWRYRPRRPPVPPRDADAEALARIQAEIDRLTVAALIGSTTAAARLADMAEDRLGIARRRMASEALTRLRTSTILRPAQESQCQPFTN